MKPTILRRTLFFIVVFSGLFSTPGLHAWEQLENNAPKGIMVVPFRVSADIDHAWLGRGVSYFIAAGLEENRIPALGDSDTEALLSSYDVRFPYGITKATVLAIAGEHKLEKVIWGEIQSADGEGGLIKVRSFIIDLKDYSQTYLPLFQGRRDDLYHVMGQILGSVLKGLGNDAQKKAPRFNLNHRNYELFIKSHLLNEAAQKIELLEKARNTDSKSDYLNFRLARAYFQAGIFQKARELLKLTAVERAEDHPFVYRKIFLGALLDFSENKKDPAITAFRLLESKGLYLFEVRHNLGVLYADRQQQETNMFAQALLLRSDPETWLYHAHQLLSRKEPALAAQTLKEAIKQYPEHKALEEMFTYFLSRETQRDVLFNVFREYIPDLSESDSLPQITYRLKSPFDVRYQRQFKNTDDVKEIEIGLRSGALDTSIEQLQALIALNPYKPEYYHLMSRLYLKKKNYADAQSHASVAVFLMPDTVNNQNLTDVGRASGKKK